MAEQDDIWYAVNVTRVVLQPRQTLETFGATTVRYHLISELMDEVGQVRVRTGKVFSERPQIITPGHFAQQLLDGFGEKAQDYADWLVNHNEMVRILKYGLQFRKEHATAETITDSLENVTDRVRETVEQGNDPLTTVVIGADELWEVSLLKFLRDYIEQSAAGNFQAIQDRKHESKLEFEREIEMDFHLAARDRSRIQPLGQKLERLGLFSKYEDRFFSLVQRG